MPNLTVKEPKAIILDFIGTAVKIGFIEKILITYLKQNVTKYLEENWKDKNVQKDVEKLRKEAAKDGSLKIVGPEAPVPEQQQSVANYVLAMTETKKESSGIQMFRFNVWFDGYRKKKITTPIYSDVAIQIKKWKDLGIKVYVLSNGWKAANKKFLSQTSHGDLNLLLDGHYDNSEGALDNKDTYTKIAGKISQPVDQCLFLTKSGAEGLAAKSAGMPAVLVMVHRKNVDKLTEEEKAMPRIRTFNELEFGEPPATQSQEGGQGSGGGEGETGAQ
jgi:enolase-phosphatase E1